VEQRVLGFHGYWNPVSTLIELQYFSGYILQVYELSVGYINFEDSSNYGAMMSSRQGGDPSSVAVSVPVSTQSQQVQTLYRSHWHLGYRSLSSKRGLPGAQAKGKINRTSVAGIGYRG
jgi:hypothetical protein